MFERFLSSLLNESLSDFIIGIDKNQLQLSLWKGAVSIENVELRSSTLNTLLRSIIPLPLLIVHACTRSLSIDIKWRRLKYEPIWVKISGLNLVVKLGRNYGEGFDTEHNLNPEATIKKTTTVEGGGEERKDSQEEHRKEKKELIDTELKAIENEAYQRKKEILEEEEESLINNLAFAEDAANRTPPTPVSSPASSSEHRLSGGKEGGTEKAAGDQEGGGKKAAMTEKMLLMILQALHIQIDDIRIQFEMDIPINNPSTNISSSTVYSGQSSPPSVEKPQEKQRMDAGKSSSTDIHPATISVLFNIASLSMIRAPSMENRLEQNILIHKQCKIRDIAISVHANKLKQSSMKLSHGEVDQIASSHIVQPFSSILKIAFNGDLSAMKGELLFDTSEIIAKLSPASAFILSLFTHEFIDAYQALENKVLSIISHQRYGNGAERKEYIELYKRTLNALWTKKLTENDYKRMEELEKEINLSDLRLYRRSSVAELKLELPMGDRVVKRSSIQDPVSHWYDRWLWGGIDDSAKNPDIILTEEDKERIFNLLAQDDAATTALNQQFPNTPTSTPTEHYSTQTPSSDTPSYGGSSNLPATLPLNTLSPSIGGSAQQTLNTIQQSTAHVPPNVAASSNNVSPISVAAALADTIASPSLIAPSLPEEIQRALFRINITIPALWMALCEEDRPFTDYLQNAVRDMEDTLINNFPHTIPSAANFYSPLFDAVGVALSRPHSARIALNCSNVRANIHFDYGSIDSTIRIKGLHLMQSTNDPSNNRENVQSDYLLAIGNLEAPSEGDVSGSSNAVEIRMHYKNTSETPSAIPDSFHGDVFIDPIHLSLNSAIFFSMQTAQRFAVANEIARLCTLFRTSILAQKKNIPSSDELITPASSGLIVQNPSKSDFPSSSDIAHSSTSIHDPSSSVAFIDSPMQQYAIPNKPDTAVCSLEPQHY